MNTLAIILASLFLLFLLGGFLYLLFQYRKLKAEHSAVRLEAERRQEKILLNESICLRLEEEKSSLLSELSLMRAEQSNDKVELSRLEERFKHLEKQYELACQEKEQVSDTLKSEFQEIMHKLLKDRSERLEESNSKTLAPLREELKLFKEQVEKSYIHEREQRTSLQNEIKGLMERSQELSKEAHQLAVALKGDSKVQGDWGEMILESILERSGLTKGENYEIQQSVKAEDGSQLRPDVVVKYPDERFIVLDSKVSLSAYIDYVNAETEEEKEQALKRHLLSVQKHVDELSRKSYSDLLGGSPDFVLMFVPNEPAYNLAMQNNPKLWDMAYQKRIILINGTNLIAALRMVQDMWRRDKQIKNVDKITKKAADMYDKFATIEETFVSLETAMSNAKKHLDTTRNQLLDGRGNLKKRMVELRDMGGLTTKKQLKKTDILE